jgi:hypothetical protein
VEATHLSGKDVKRKGGCEFDSVRIKYRARLAHLSRPGNLNRKGGCEFVLSVILILEGP